MLHPGDVVYADIPYEGTDQAGYGKGKFNKQAFVEWAQAQDVPVYVSEYSMPEGWTEIDSFEVPGMRGGKRTEKLFVQSKFADQVLESQGNKAGRNGEQVRFSLLNNNARLYRDMSKEEKKAVRSKLEETEADDATEYSIVAREGVSARNAAMEWAENNIANPITVDTEIGGLVINKKSISDSLAHGFSQAKLDAIPTIIPAFKNKKAVYIGSSDDINGDPIVDNYFAYPIKYKDTGKYVFCRTREDQNTHRLYIHEVITEDDIRKGQTLQSTALKKPRTGLPLYRYIMSDIFNDKYSESSLNLQENAGEISRPDENKTSFSFAEVTPEENKSWIMGTEFLIRFLSSIFGLCRTQFRLFFQVAGFRLPFEGLRR